MRNIKIGNKEYKVIETAAKITCENKDCLGLVDHDNFTVYIAAKQTDEQKEETLMHEIIHIISEYFQLKLSEKNATLIARGLLDIKKNGGFK